MEGKRKLLEDQLRKEIGQIRKMVVLVWEICIVTKHELPSYRAWNLFEYAHIAEVVLVNFTFHKSPKHWDRQVWWENNADPDQASLKNIIVCCLLTQGG